ncbi:alpha/beta fold hydrolase [Deinococcus knuensis]|uniref:Transporter n=1 Tax=Deinococcus knuensis TaxID=1837380 RepID=A0ABQ2SET4_9DEIO|nr:alpha/beta fold hydrolase [Deinococcus knuensis]GGS26443.1 transporter [Deinococcus knuensis]
MKLNRSALALLPLTAALAACNPTPTPTAPDPMAPFTGQILGWAACDATILGSDNAALFSELGSRLQCADMTVPQNWAKPDAGRLSVSLIRVTASDSKQRQGAIFFNPGGPGGDGLTFAPFNAYFWANGDTSTTRGANLKKMTEQYDLIGFSPRGVGASSRLYCGSNELIDPINPPAADRSDANVKRMIRAGKLVAQACQKNPLTPFINTDATARDLNLARQLLGDQKLNYIGYSYGTWLGSWYAKTFPEHTGRMLLDGNMSWNETMQDAFGLQPAAFERDFRDSAAPYLARQNALLGLGDTGEKVYAAQNALSEPLRSITANNTAGLMYSRDQLLFIGLVLKPAVVVDRLIRMNPNADLFDLLNLSAQQTYFPDPQLNETGVQLAQTLLFMRDDLLNAQPGPAELDSFNSTFTAITCNDTAWKSDLSAARALDDREARDYPLIGGASVSNPCLQWKGGPSVQQPKLPANMPPVLMLQNELDPATPQEGALRALNSTPSAKMIFIDDEPQHAAFPYGTDCVDGPITTYFLNGTLPGEKLSRCAALPLPGENAVVPVKTQGVSPMKRANDTVAKNLKVQNGALCVATPTLSAQSLREQRVSYARDEARRIIERDAQRIFTAQGAYGLQIKPLIMNRCQ